MNWETINKVAVILSATAATISIVQLKTGARRKKSQNRGWDKKFLYYFILASSGWSLGVLSWTWIFQPYGAFISAREMRHVIGLILSFPALGLFWFGLRKLALLYE